MRRKFISLSGGTRQMTKKLKRGLPVTPRVWVKGWQGTTPANPVNLANRGNTGFTFKEYYK